MQKSIYKKKDNRKEKNITDVVIVVKKRTVKKIIFGMLVVCLLGIGVYRNTRSIEGKWIRVNDDNQLQGMMVNVEGDEAVIIKPSNNKSLGYGFVDGTIKWKKIEKIGWGKYRWQDAISEDSTGTVYYDNSYSEAIVSLFGNKMTVTVKTTDKNGRSGLYQEWVKQ